MLAFIDDIIRRFGGRYYGSEQERQAQLHTAEVLKQYCDKVRVEQFMSALESHFQSLKGFCLGYALVLLLLQVNTALAAVLGLLNAVLFLGHVITYRHWLDFLFPKKPSWNVIGDIEPLGEARSTVIVAGHIDSVREFKWWFRFKQNGAVLTILSAILIILLGVYAPLRFFIAAPWFAQVWWGFVVLAPVLIVLFDMHGEQVVHGASDNLTGVALAVEMARVFSAERMQHTRLRLISFGAEEACLRGSWAYAKQHKEELLREKAFLFNLDTIKDTQHLTIGTVEANTLAFFRKEDIRRAEEAFIAAGVPVKKLPLMMGASDASAFHMLGLPAVSIIGMDSQRLDPVYHTRLDVLENINPQALESMKKVLVCFLHNWDSRQ